jgi:HSP20 family protein
MAITRWDPFTALAQMDREFDNLVARGWGSPAARAGFVPPVEIITKDSDVVIRLELPGIDVANDVDVEVDKGRLVIRGERRAGSDEQRGSYLVRELRYGSFRREFALPDGVTADAVEAQYDNGMLEVVVHDAVRREPEPRRITIGQGRAGQTVDAVAAGETS